MRSRLTRGFTMIEILVVITIIIILAVMGAGAYSVGRRIAIIDLHAEKLVSQLNSLRDKSQAVTPPKCIGVYFEKNAAPKKIEMPYLNARQGCDHTQETKLDMDWQKDVLVTTIKVNGQPQDSALPIVFVPPHGALAPISGISNESDNTTFTLELTYKDRTRTVEINESSGTIEKKIQQ